MEGNVLLWATIITRMRMSLSMTGSGGKCWSPHCVLTPYALRTNAMVDVKGEMVSHSGWCTTKGEVSDAAEWAPATPKSAQLSCCIHNTTYSRDVLSRFILRLGEGMFCYVASIWRQPTSQQKPATRLITAQRSPCVKPNCGVNAAKTSEESPLEDNRKTADWL